MSEHRATIVWQRGDQPFTDNAYSRKHEWRFDGGVSVPASASPDVVPPPMSVADAVDPEEAFVAALASCHMLTFLAIAAKRGHVVDSYTDAAIGYMGRNAEGRTCVTQVVLEPRVSFAGDSMPTGDRIRKMHDQAHHGCFIANSVTTEVITRVTV
jgi:organic hydroperoxide reductase OsmC/OhrA